MTRADLEAAAAEKYPQPKKVVGASSLGEVTYTYGPVPRSERAAYIQGREDALPENPDPAVIEAMAKALYNPVNNKSMIRWAHLIDRDKGGYRRQARAAYAAMRGAMQ